MRLANGNWSDALADTPENQAQYGQGSGYQGNYGYNGPTPAPGNGGGGGGGGGANTASMDVPGLGTVSGMSGDAIDQYLKAIETGNAAAAAEAIRQFNVIHQFDQQTFDQQTAANAQNLATAQAALTGLYNGKPTLAAQLQNANITGLDANGNPTQAAREFATTSGLNALTLASNTQPNAFRQAQALYGLGQGGYTPLMNAASGLGPAVTPFQAPTLSAADTGTLGWLAGQTGTGSYTANQAQSWMNSLPGANQVNWSALAQAGPGAQQLVQQGLAAKWGLNPLDVQAIQKAAMPGFSAPTLAGTFKG